MFTECPSRVGPWTKQTVLLQTFLKQWQISKHKTLQCQMAIRPMKGTVVVSDVCKWRGHGGSGKAPLRTDLNKWETEKRQHLWEGCSQTGQHLQGLQGDSQHYNHFAKHWHPTPSHPHWQGYVVSISSCYWVPTLIWEDAKNNNKKTQAMFLPLKELKAPMNSCHGLLVPVCSPRCYRQTLNWLRNCKYQWQWLP